MKKDILVSVIVPAYNCEDHIYKCVSSILEQSYRHVEVIVINDGSSDSTGSILSEMKDPRLIVKETLHAGVSQARNTGIDIASGDCIMFVDSDDLVRNDAVSRLLSDLSDEDMLSVCGYERIFIKNGKEKHRFSQFGNIRISGDRDFCEHFRSLSDAGVFLHVWGKLYNADIIRKNRLSFICGYSIGEDVLFNIDYLKHIESFSVFNEPLYIYSSYFRKNSLTGAVNHDRFRTALEVYSGYKCLLEMKEAYDPLNMGSVTGRYFRDCCNHLEQYFFRERMDKARKIIDTGEHDAVLHDGAKMSAGSRLYWSVFRIGSPLVLSYFCGIRKFVKKIVRG